MRKQVLAISSSPRKGGNSETLCRQFMAGAQAAGHQAELVLANACKINYCTGCGACLNGARPCPQQDDMAQILEKMIAADVIVLATPVYFYTMSGQLKTLIDRVCARYTEIQDKEFYFIMTAADSDNQAMARTVEEFRGFTACLPGAREKGIIYGSGVWQVGEVKDKPLMQAAFELGRQV